MPRWSLLRHTGAPDDPSGCHFDLLLEDGKACRTWRLNQPPELGLAPQPAAALPDHRLVWLDPRSAAVSGEQEGYCAILQAQGEHAVIQPRLTIGRDIRVQDIQTDAIAKTQ